MRDRNLFWVRLVDRRADGGVCGYGVVFECDLPSVEAVGQELREYGVVSGRRVRTLPGGAVERRDFLFGSAAVLTVQPYTPGAGRAGT